MAPDLCKGAAQISPPPVPNDFISWGTSGEPDRKWLVALPRVHFGPYVGAAFPVCAALRTGRKGMPRDSNRFSSPRYGPAERHMAESLVEIERQLLGETADE